ncbi:MAG: hypothetical protein KGD65_03310 [Candidatus Lokiarchaeota archaeon]|nr:hypothetical protein [Candidatus Lokiarchaeota archaeon]
MVISNFKVDEFDIDLENPSEAIVSMLLWMMLEPNIFSVVKWGPDNLLYLDIYSMFDQSHIDSSNVANHIEGSFIWGNIPGFTVADFNTFKQRFDKLFKYGDIMHFLSFHNHELDNNFTNIIDYIMDKVLKYSKLRIKDLDRKSKIIDLRIE